MIDYNSSIFYHKKISKVANKKYCHTKFKWELGIHAIVYCKVNIYFWNTHNLCDLLWQGRAGLQKGLKR